MPPKKQSGNNKSSGNKSGKKSGNNGNKSKKATSAKPANNKPSEKLSAKEQRKANFEKSLQGASGMQRMSAVNMSSALTPQVRMLQMRSGTFNQAHYDRVMKICRPILLRFCAAHQIDNAVEGLAMAALSYEVALNQLMAAVQHVIDAEASGSAFNPAELIQLLIFGNWYKLNGIFNIAVEDRELFAAITMVVNSGGDFATFDRITKKLNMHDSMYKLNTLLSQHGFAVSRAFKPAEMETVEDWELMGEELAARNNAEAAVAVQSSGAKKPMNESPAAPALPSLSGAEESDYEQYSEPEYYSEGESDSEGMSNVRLLSPEKQAALLNKVKKSRSGAKASGGKMGELENSIAKAKMSHTGNTKLDRADAEIAARMGRRDVNTSNKAQAAKSSVLEIKSKHTKKAEKYVVNLSAFKRLVANLDKSDRVLVPMVRAMLVELSSADNIEAYIATLPVDKQADAREKLTTFVNNRLPVILGLISKGGPKSAGPNNNNNGGRKQSSRSKSKQRN